MDCSLERWESSLVTSGNSWDWMARRRAGLETSASNLEMWASMMEKSATRTTVMLGCKPVMWA
jgi:hypothetical protein